MADDAPVSDVLCEAMEYLSKLGSNLRARSETLKEKKINRDKLKNAHAVKKAADKVLLICELSKKSIENVEFGVKKLLSTVNASQTSSTGDKTSIVPKGTITVKKPDYQYFEYKSRKLKIAKKIPVKHYMSAKVKVKRIPGRKLDKYPVYYDCKLLRLRKRSAEKEQSRREHSDRSSLKPNNKISPNKDSQCHKSEGVVSSESDSPKLEPKIEEKKRKYRHDSKSSDIEIINESETSKKTKDKEHVPHSDDLCVSLGTSKSKKKDVDLQEDIVEIPSKSNNEDNNKAIIRTQKRTSDDIVIDSSTNHSDSETDKHNDKSNLSDSDDVNRDAVDSPRESESTKNDDTYKSDSDDTHKNSKHAKEYKKSKTDKGNNSNRTLVELESSKTASNEEDNSGSAPYTEKKVNKSRSDHLNEKKSDCTTSDIENKEEPSESINENESSGSNDDKLEKLNRKGKKGSSRGSIESHKKREKEFQKDTRKDDFDKDKESENERKKKLIYDSSESDNSNGKSEKSEKQRKRDRKDSDLDKNKKHSHRSSESSKIKSVKLDSYDSARRHAEDSEVKQSSRKIKERKDSQSDEDKKKKVSISKSNLSDRSKNKKEIYKSESKKFKGLKSKKTDKVDTDSDEDKEKFKSKKVSESDSDSDSDRKKHKLSKEHRRSLKSKKMDKVDTDSDKDEKEVKPKEVSESDSEKEQKNYKQARAIEDSDSSQENDRNMNKHDNIGFDGDKTSPDNAATKQCEVIDLDDENDESKSGKQGLESNDQNQGPESEPQKPLLKLVSLTKLLKPDVLKKVEQFSEKPATKLEEKPKKGKTSAMKNTYKKDNLNSTPKRVRYEDEEEFWRPKRKEVKAFKPKQFTIDIVRLPKLSVSLLSKYNLKKITRKGSIICELSDEHSNTATNETSSDKVEKVIDEPVPDVNMVKSALLIDSDSEKSDTDPVNINKETRNLSEESKNVKNTLLNDSDSDNNHAEPDNKKNNQTSDNNDNTSDGNQEENKVSVEKKREENLPIQPLEVSGKEKSKEKSNDEGSDLQEQNNKTSDREMSPTKEDADKVKSALLNDSSSDSPKTADKIKQKNTDSTPNSKRKNMMQSIRAKKMLLTYSSSSESENEKENSVMKEMKESLLRGNSSDEDSTLKNGARKKLLHSSDSDDDVLKRVKKKRKLRSKSSSEKDTQRDENKKSKNEDIARKKLLSSSDSNDDVLKRVKKKRKLRSKSSSEKDTQRDENKKSKNEDIARKKLLSSSDSNDDVLKRVKKKRKVRSKSSSEKEIQDEEKNSKNEDLENVEITKDATINQVDGAEDEVSDTSSRKMGRSRQKPTGSSSHNSDSPDDKDIDGLTNLNSLNNPRRRGDSNEKASTSSKKNKMSKKTPLISGEGLLEASLSSDEASAAESDAVEEELPPISLSGLNGGAIHHLAKDDLLGESDSSSSNDKDDKKEEESEDSDGNLKARRRKPNAISSDSEAGSSRQKKVDPKVSDFEDSEEENSEPVTKSKRKKKNSDSDGSYKSSNDESKKKRRRIKQIDSDVSGSDSENEGKKHGRKNIRRVMGKNQLEEATKKAAREEKERMARIAERQKMYNNLEFDETGKPDEVVPDKVILDFDPETKEPLIEVDRGLVKKLKPHQANGIKFMWDACFESVKRIKKDRGSGCILAHCMGLGKTLQVISLTHTLLIHSDLTGVNRVLVVCPLSTVLNWVNEIRMWLKFAHKEKDVDVYELSRYKQNSERAYQLSEWFTGGGVCVLGYEMFRNLSADNPKKFKKKMLKNFQEALVDPGPDLVVCDEGHLLKNEKTSLSQSMNRVRTRRRIVLTGTPLQNNLKEYYCMVQFVKPNLLGKYNEYLNRFVNPITNGQYTDSTEHDIRIMKRRSHVLHTMLDGAVQRRDYGVLAPFLPPKHEYVLFITLTEIQTKLYQHYLDNYSRRPLPGKSSGFLFPDFQSLQRIWTHPLVLKYNSERYEIMQQKKREREEEDSEGSLVDFIDDDSSPEETSTEESSDDLSDVSDDSRKKSKKKKADKKEKKKAKDAKAATRRGTRANPMELEEDLQDVAEVVEVKTDNPTEWWIPMVTDDEIEDIRNSHKLVLLFEILRQCEAIGDKLLVFSQSLYSLDLIEHFLGKIDEATQEGRLDEKLGNHVGSWSPGIDYFRLDGSTSCENRSIWCKNFNKEDNPRARLFLISTRAGGLGINLVAANRVVIFDVSWNPSHDVQSIFRVYRFGQKKPCYVYRFLAMGTMEEKIYERQVTKQAISKRVIDEQQIDRHYAENDLAELYNFEPTPPMPRPIPPVPKDRLFAEMLKEHETAIYKFHEHDSLLENKEEETLSVEERKAAWDDFENEKNRPPPAPFPSAWPMHNGMVPNMMAQQQQQLAYAALAAMLRKDMPNITDDHIRGMLPLIYGANPGLMQKLSDIYKYPQANNMMNPAMMNPVMNAGGAMGVGGSGTSGLQYEPPWAREQQQQQQLRLQQLMQHQQNQMGAKIYAGGLGSRDPVAMALQQQRAREIMMGDRGRPRGRPPLAARASPAAPGDVVNLDSD